MVGEFYIAFGITFAMVKPVAALVGAESANDSLMKACDSGYHGKDCRELCPHPSFGNQCTGKCRCKQHLCHHIYGCPPLGTNCPLGLTGRYCETTCQYPQYGFACQQTCMCSKTRCNSSTGCVKKDTIRFHQSSQKMNIITTTQNKGTNETLNKTEGNFYLNDDLSTANGTVKENSVNLWTGKSLPQPHPQLNKNTWTQNILLSLGIVLFALVIMHALLSVNNCVQKRKRITYV